MSNIFLPVIARKRASAGGTWTANNATLSAKDAWLENGWALSDLSDSIGSSTLTNVGASTFVAGKHNDCLNLDGSAQYLSAADGPVFAANHLLVTFWFKNNGSPNAAYILGHIGAPTSDRAWSINTSTSDNTLKLYSSTNGTAWNQVSGLSLGTMASVWTKYEFARIGDVWRTYKNGTFQSTVTAGGTVHNSSNKLYFGANVNTPRYTKGQIDQVAIWNGLTWASTAEVDTFVGNSGLNNSGTGAFLI